MIRYHIADPECIESIEEAFWSAGALSVTLLDAGDEPLLEPGPGETPIWTNARIEALVPDGVTPNTLVRALGECGIAAAASDLESVELPDRDWERAWMDRFEPMRFGEKIWICPWHIDPDPAWPVVVRLDPGLAFGTGTHATTALCLEWLDAAELEGRALIDYGCGSGVLAIAAALRGAGRVVAIDHDPQALEATRDNAERNGVGDRIGTFCPESAAPARADIVLANILAGTLVELAERITGLVAPGGALVLSGILAGQADEVERAYASVLQPVGQDSRDGWMRLDFRR